VDEIVPKKYKIAVVPGDGIGPEVCNAAVEAICAAAGRETFELVEYPAGAAHFRKSGTALPEETFEGCKAADAILHGAAGIPGVVYPDGTEAGIEFGLQLRFRLDLYANVRPIRLHQGVVSPLRDAEPGDIDYVILRENTEGLYASRGGGTNVRDEAVTDTLLMTRNGVERIARKAFELSRKRNGAPKDGIKRVTVCDKANVLRSYAFFRKVCTEVAQDYPDIELDFGYADAMMVHMVRRPSFYDVIVTENMFGDIISDLGAVTVGSMGMSPSAELGHEHAFFQASHGSAPDIAGMGVANPLGTILAGSMMLDWLGERHQDDALVQASKRIDAAVKDVLRTGEFLPMDLGGQAKSDKVTAAVCRALDRYGVAA
jgi:3-isopropylmalate dehydrogenase